MQKIDPNILGNADNVNKELIHPMAWCLAKTMLLFDPDGSLIPAPYDDNKDVRTYFEMAQRLTRTTANENSDNLLLQIPPFEVWAELAEEAGIAKEVLNIIRLMAVVDPERRPLALQVLRSPEYDALQRAATKYHS